MMKTNDLGDRQPLSPGAERFVEAAMEVLGSGEELTLRKVARRVGKTAMAPYAHFAGGFPQLLQVTAARGFDRLTEQLEAAVPGAEASAADPAARLAAVAGAYLAFARRNRRLYALMFGPATTQQETPATGALVSARLRAQRLVERVVRGALPTELRDQDRVPLVMAWGLMHGVTSLALDGQLQYLGLGAEHDATVATLIAEFVVGALRD